MEGKEVGRDRSGLLIKTMGTCAGSEHPSLLYFCSHNAYAVKIRVCMAKMFNMTIPGPFASGSARPKRKIIDLSYSWTI